MKFILGLLMLALTGCASVREVSEPINRVSHAVDKANMQKRQAVVACTQIKITSDRLFGTDLRCRKD